MRSSPALLVFTTLLIFGALSGGLASAQPRRGRRAPDPQPTESPEQAQARANDAAARGRFDAGLAFYQAGRFEEALTEFTAAWELSQRPEMLINIANAAERSLKFDVALEHLQLFLERVPDSPDRAAIELRIERNRRTLAHSTAPASSLTTPAQTPNDDTREESGGPSIAGIITLSAGGALAVGALITGLVAHGTYGELQDACPSGVCPADRQSDLDSGETLALVSTVLTGLAVVAGGIGLVLLIFDGDDAEDAPPTSARLELAPGPAPLGATARVRF